MEVKSKEIHEKSARFAVECQPQRESDRSGGAGGGNGNARIHSTDCATVAVTADAWL